MDIHESIKEYTENLKEVLQDRKEELSLSREMTNDFLIEDLLLMLGYNKRKNKNIKRLYNNSAMDWEILIGENTRICVNVYAVDSDLKCTDITETLEFAKDVQASVIIVTDGIKINIYKISKDKEQFNLVKELDITNLATTDIDILQAITESKCNMSYLDSVVENNNNITTIKVSDTIRKNIEAVSRMIANMLNTKNMTAVEQTIQEILENKQLVNQSKQQTEIAEQQKEIDEQMDKLTKQIEELSEKNKELTEQLISLEEQQKEQQNAEEQQEQQEQIDTLNQQLREKDEQISSLNEQLKEKQEKFNEQIESLTEQLNQEIDKNKALTEQLNQIKAINEQKATEESEKLEASEEADKKLSQSEKDKYISQIRELSVKLSNSQEEVREHKNEIERLNEKIASISGSDKEKARELLSIIEDGPDVARNYVAVIGTELIQFDKLNTFVGRVLQKLYELKNFEAQQYIYNGEIFKLDTNAKNNDLVMGNKAYDIILGDASEDEVLNKIRIVFSHFSDIIFECKKIGNLEITKLHEENEIKQEQQEQAVETDEFENMESMDMQELEGIQMQEFNGPSEEIDTLLAGQLLNIDLLVSTEENVQFKSIKYIGNNNITFKINGENLSNSLLLTKCIDAILAIEVYNRREDIVITLKRTDFSAINNYFVRFSDETKALPRINGTGFVVKDIDDIREVAVVLLEICNALEIDTSEMFIYFTATTTSQYLKENYSFPEESIQLRENMNYQLTDNAQSDIAILKGDMFNNITITKHSLIAHKDILLKSEAVKTRYFAKVLNSNEDVEASIGKMIETALSNNLQVNTRAFGNLIGTNYKLVSQAEEEVGESYVELEILGKTYFIPSMEDWQVPHSLIKVHTTLFNDMAIAIKNQVNIEAIGFYNEEFCTAEPTLSLAVDSFVSYVNSCIAH